MIAPAAPRKKTVRLSQESHRHLAMLLGTTRTTTQQVWLYLIPTLGSAHPSARAARRIEKPVDAVRSLADDLYARDYGHTGPPATWPYYPVDRYLPPMVLRPQHRPRPARRRRPSLWPADYAYLLERLTLGYGALAMAEAMVLPALGATAAMASRLVRLWRSAGTFDRLLMALEEHYWEQDAPYWTPAAHETFRGNMVTLVRTQAALSPEMEAWLRTIPLSGVPEKEDA